MSDRKFLEVTNSSDRGKLLIDVDDISRVKSITSLDYAAPSGAFGIIVFRDGTVRYTLEDYYQIREALAGLCEIKSIKE